MSRRALFETCGRLGLAHLLLRAQSRLGTAWLTVLAYHRVCDTSSDTPWDSDVVSATPVMFRRQLELITKYFTPVTSGEVVTWFTGATSLPKNPVVLTFDDGYRDSYDVVLPLLQEAGVPADFFVCPGNIEQRRLFWWDIIACCLRRSTKRRISLSYPRPLELDLSDGTCTERARRVLLRIVKRTYGLDVQRLMEELQHEAGVALDHEAESERLLLTWDQVRALRRAGMGVGSHSYSHPILSMVDDASCLWLMMRRLAGSSAGRSPFWRVNLAKR